jgi:hypothetical protein
LIYSLLFPIIVPYFWDNPTWNVEKINAHLAWAQTGFTGNGIKVGVLDTGTDYNHTDLHTNIWNNLGEDADGDGHTLEWNGSNWVLDPGDINGIDDDGNDYIDDLVGYDFSTHNQSRDNNPMDDDDHGTHVSGTIAGNGSSGTQTGVAPQAKLMVCKVLTNGNGYPSDAIAAIDYGRENGADILNLSIGWIYYFHYDPETENDPRADFRYACDAAIASGVVMCIAAGNEGDWSFPSVPHNLRTPGDVPSVISVGATDIDDEIAYFSSRGPVTWSDVPEYTDYSYPPGLLKPDVSAPGVNITSTLRGGGYEDGWDGTSMATPAVSGTAALLLQANSNLTPAQIKDILEKSSLDLGTTGKDAAYGSGRDEALQSAILALAYTNKSISSQSTSFNGQRKFYRVSSSTWHEVFTSGSVNGGEIFYRKTTNGGTSWNITKRLSDGKMTNLAPCITMGAGSTVIVVWQRKNGSNYDVVFSRSTNGGSSWSSISSLQSNFSCTSPGPLPSVSGNINTGDVIVVYRTSSGLRFVKSTSNMGSWNSPVTISGTNGNYNSPSTAFYPITSPVVDKCNLAYATNTGYTSQLYYNYYLFETSSWSASTNLSSVLPSHYQQHCNPTLSSSTNTTIPVHVAWESYSFELDNVVVHRKGTSGNFGSQYYILQNQSARLPSISGLTSDNAWMVFRNSSTGQFAKIKYYYSGGSWIWGSPSYISSGNYPQLSVGSSNAKYLWTSGSSSPYTISIGSETLTKEVILASEYSRELNFLVPSGIDNKTGSSISVEIKQPQIIHKDGNITLIPFVDAPPDSIIISPKEILAYGNTRSFVPPQDIDSLKFQFAVRMTNGEKILEDVDVLITFDIYDASSGNKLDRISSQSFSEDKDNNKWYQVNLTAANFSNTKYSSGISIHPAVLGLKNDNPEMIASLGHIYKFNTEGFEIPKDILTETNTPKEYLLEQNYPNPFNPATTISYQLPADGVVTLKIFDVLGNEVRELVNEFKTAGRYETKFDASELASGIYIYQIKVNNLAETIGFSSVKKLIFMK